MKPFKGIVFLLLGLLSFGVIAQSSNMQDLTRDAIRANKKLIVAQNVPLTKEQEAAFWPMYREYQKEIESLNARLGKVIQDYADNINGLTDEKAHRLLTEYLDIESDRTQMKKVYVERFSRRLPGKVVVRYFQVEQKIEAIVDFELARVIPLVQ